MTKATAWALAIGAVVGLIITGKMVMDATSAGRIARLHPRLRSQARQLLSLAAARGIDLRVVSGLRTYEEQAALYAQGRHSDQCPTRRKLAQLWAGHGRGALGEWPPQLEYYPLG